MAEKQNITVPVLLIIFNRPDCLKEVFGAIREAKPRELYVFADGPRTGHDEDIRLCSEARAITENIDWDCNVHRFYSDCNLGCGKGPARGISWVFENNEKAIILEDDCVPTTSFFMFCQELLEKYENDPRAMTISGLNFDIESASQYDYYFSNYNNTWGWATWKRVWDKYDYEIKDYEEFRKSGRIQEIVLYKHYAEYWEKVFEGILNGKETAAWDAQFMFMSFKYKGLHIYPQKNLVRYVGFGDDATHTRINDHDHRFVYGTSKHYDIQFPLKHPEEVHEDFRADCIRMEECYGARINPVDSVNDELLEVIRSADRLILYGAGKKCEQLITELHKNGIDKFYIATTNEENKYILGNKVNKITELVDLKDTLVVITVKNQEVIKEIKDNLTRLGFTNMVSVY